MSICERDAAETIWFPLPKGRAGAARDRMGWNVHFYNPFGYTCTRKLIRTTVWNYYGKTEKRSCQRERETVDAVTAQSWTKVGIGFIIEISCSDIPAWSFIRVDVWFSPMLNGNVWARTSNRYIPFFFGTYDASVLYSCLWQIGVIG